MRNFSERQFPDIVDYHSKLNNQSPERQKSPDVSDSFDRQLFLAVPLSENFAYQVEDGFDSGFSDPEQSHIFRLSDKFFIARRFWSFLFQLFARCDEGDSLACPRPDAPEIAV